MANIEESFFQRNVPGKWSSFETEKDDARIETENETEIEQCVADIVVCWSFH